MYFFPETCFASTISEPEFTVWLYIYYTLGGNNAKWFQINIPYITYMPYNVSFLSTIFHLCTLLEFFHKCNLDPDQEQPFSQKHVKCQIFYEASSSTA